jgi:hypothetical protein
VAPRRNAIVAVKRMFNWAVKDAGLLPDSPLKNVKRPPKKRRNRVMTEAEREFVMKTIRDEQFREYVFAMLDTGARPGEVMAVTGISWSPHSHPASANRLRQHGHSPSCPLIRANNAVGCGSVMIALKASGARWA